MIAWLIVKKKLKKIHVQNYQEKLIEYHLFLSEFCASQEVYYDKIITIVFVIDKSFCWRKQKYI